MEESKKELTIYLIILNVFTIKKNGNQLKRLVEWMFIEKKMEKFLPLKITTF